MKVSKKLLLALSVSVIMILAISTSVSAASEKTGVVTGTVVNFRKEPDLSAKVLLKLQKGTKVTVIDSRGDWYHVVYNDAYGWMHSDWLDVSEKSIATGIVTGTVVNVRSRPTTSSAVIAKYRKNTKVEIFEKSGNWYRVSIGEDRYGWMSADWVKETVSRGSQADRTVADNKDGNADKAGDAQQTGDVPPGTEEPADGDAAQSEDKVDRQALVEYAKKFLGVKYEWGKESPKTGFDCSGFVWYVYDKFGISITRQSSSQAQGGRKISKSELKPGDLVFFDTNDKNGKLNDISHVGIYIGDGKFIHASTYEHKKIVIESLSSSYYSKRYMCARDYISK